MASLESTVTKKRPHYWEVCRYEVSRKDEWNGVCCNASAYQDGYCEKHFVIISKRAKSVSWPWHYNESYRSKICPVGMPTELSTGQGKWCLFNLDQGSTTEALYNNWDKITDRYVFKVMAGSAKYKGACFVIYCSHSDRDTIIRRIHTVIGLTEKVFWKPNHALQSWEASAQVSEHSFIPTPESTEPLLTPTYKRCQWKCDRNVHTESCPKKGL